MAVKILDDAAKVIEQRQESYAPPEINFQRIAEMWSIILKTKVTPKEVALLLIALKITREMNAYSYDNWLDIIGYAVLGDLVSK